MSRSGRSKDADAEGGFAAAPADVGSAWQITDVEAADTDPDPIALKLKFDEHWYRLRRK
ncbi:MAG TPA: hypothetical protein VFQ68_10015 [Streptosporangiaceae bacterium]|nr:hypothetical protein [Streptosporangiaceae bacterium]